MQVDQIEKIQLVYQQTHYVGNESGFLNILAL